MKKTKEKILVLNGWSTSPVVEKFGITTADIEDFKIYPTEYKMVLFTGGPDVSPELYNDTSPKNICFVDKERDEEEKVIFDIASVLNIPMVGICRGAQFLNVMCGGTLIHDMKGHSNSHLIQTHDSKSPFSVTSSHHQMCLVGKEGFILGWSFMKLSDYYVGFNDNHIDYKGQEVEVIAYPKHRVFGVQYHPEWMDETSIGYQWFQRMVKDLLELSRSDFYKSHCKNIASIITM